MAITCIVVDDEEMAIEHLLSYIDKVPFLKLEASFLDPTEALTFLDDHPVDLVLLDIEMPNFAIDGMDFIKISGHKHNYILTTAYPKYALPSYDYDVVDFLCKPFPFDRFLKAVNKVRSLSESTSDEPESDDHTYVRVDGKLQRIDFTEILWIESERTYVSIYTPTDRINLHLSLSELEALLPSKLFIRVHKSYIVSKKRIDLIEKEQLGIKKESQTKLIPIGEAYRKSLIKAIFPNKKNKPA
ncbi:response regulator transcription factor [Spirosoma sp. BT702]|uniref:Response regulator transcription factor n=1 Tax=Spirosoma profusum TaxID=2771354 RepID=A0A927AP65_9BACT|nr:LytTR family DNA-binding domain-containing protein [Spirosoma profusum]MBD2703364.1 response regulator transcription factor [Spirosoma profusum]